MTCIISKQIKCRFYHGEATILSTKTLSEYPVSGNEFFTYGFHETPYGEALAMATPKGLCALAFVRDGNRDDALRARTNNYKYGSWHENPLTTQPYIDQIFYSDDAQDLKIFVRGTDFQVRVWEALLSIACGQTASYADIACLVNSPKAVQAAGQAISRNPIAYLIPCHRVVRKSGSLGGYRWGSKCKIAILNSEGIDMKKMDEIRKAA